MTVEPLVKATRHLFESFHQSAAAALAAHRWPDSISHRVVRRPERKQGPNQRDPLVEEASRPDTSSVGLSRPLVDGVDLSSHPSGKLLASSGGPDGSFIPSEMRDRLPEQLPQ